MTKKKEEESKRQPDHAMSMAVHPWLLLYSAMMLAVSEIGSVADDVDGGNGFQPCCCWIVCLFILCSCTIDRSKGEKLWPKWLAVTIGKNGPAMVPMLPCCCKDLRTLGMEQAFHCFAIEAHIMTLVVTL
jgi:hypothetical protein